MAPCHGLTLLDAVLPQLPFQRAEPFRFPTRALASARRAARTEKKTTFCGRWWWACPPSLWCARVGWLGEASCAGRTWWCWRTLSGLGSRWAFTGCSRLAVSRPRGWCGTLSPCSARLRAGLGVGRRRRRVCAGIRASERGVGFKAWLDRVECRPTAWVSGGRSSRTRCLCTAR